MEDVDEVIHQPWRLRIMAVLVALHPEVTIATTELRTAFDVTDGNLGAHLRKLEDAGYVDVCKTFVDRKPRTFLRATETGRRAFQKYVAALKEVIRLAEDP